MPDPRLETLLTEMEAVLIIHQRKDIGGCICGWGVETGQLGRSFARHQAEALLDADIRTRWQERHGSPPNSINVQIHNDPPPPRMIPVAVRCRRCGHRP